MADRVIEQCLSDAAGLRDLLDTRDSLAGAAPEHLALRLRLSEARLRLLDRLKEAAAVPEPEPHFERMSDRFRPRALALLRRGYPCLAMDTALGTDVFRRTSPLGVRALCGHPASPRDRLRNSGCSRDRHVSPKRERPAGSIDDGSRMQSPEHPYLRRCCRGRWRLRTHTKRRACE